MTLSAQDNAKILQQLKVIFERKINWSKYQLKVLIERQNQYLNYLFDPSFQGVNRLFVLSFENNDDRKVHAWYFLPKVEIKDYNVMINGQNLFGQPVRNELTKNDNNPKTATGQGNDYISDCLLDHPYSKEHHKLIAIDLSKQEALDANPKEMQQINFAVNLDQVRITAMFLIIEEEKETKWVF